MEEQFLQPKGVVPKAWAGRGEGATQDRPVEEGSAQGKGLPALPLPASMFTCVQAQTTWLQSSVPVLPCFQAGDVGSIPSQGIRISHAVGQLSPHTATSKSEPHSRREPTCCNEDPAQPKKGREKKGIQWESQQHLPL